MGIDVYANLCTPVQANALTAARQGTVAAAVAEKSPSVRLFWDLDNINAKNAEHALVIGHRLKSTAQRLTGLPPALSAYANEFTVERLRLRSTSASWEAVLEMLEVQLVVAGLEKDAADMLMRRDMLEYAQQQGPLAAVVCISNDQGFGPALERCGRMGAFTVAVGTYLRNSGFNWSQRPSQLPLPAAANCIVAWHPGRPQQHSKSELALVADWQQRLQAESPALEGAPPAAHRKLHKGVCCTRWLNPNRPLPPDLAHVLPGNRGAQRRAAAASCCTGGGP